MATKGIQTIFGGGSIAFQTNFTEDDTLEPLYKVLKDGGCTVIDTARIYGNGEERMGRTGAGRHFTIDSKTPGGFVAGESTGDGIVQHAKETIERLKIDQLDVYYIHAPDPSLDLEDMLRGINEVHKLGFFKRFGLSNFKAEDVERAHAISKEKGYPLPTVYQGNYSPIARRQETELFPVLRKLGIAFYAYSPLAGGFLTKSKEQIVEKSQDAGRFAEGHALSDMYGQLYAKPSYLKALDLWAAAAEDAGCSKAELAYRWVTFDSPLSPKHGDGLIFGANGLPQAKETLAWCNAGSVGEKAKAKIDEIWKTIEKEAPIDNYYR